MVTTCTYAKNVINRPTVKRNAVHIVIKDGLIYDAYANCDVDVIIYDLDTDDPDMLEEVEQAVEKMMQDKDNHEIEIL